MRQVIVDKQGPEAFQDNEHGYQDTYTQQRDYKPPQQKTADFRVYAVWGIIAIVALLLFWIVYSIWKWLYCMSDLHFATCRSLDAAEPIGFAVMFFAPVALFIGNVALKVWTRTRYENALANKANLVLNRYGDQEPADFYDRLTTQQIVEFLRERYDLATLLETRVAPHKLYRGVNSLSIGGDTTNHTGGLLEAPDDGDVLTPIPPSQWLEWLNDQPHMLFGAMTGKGKSTTAKAVLNLRIERGDLIFVIDPHSDDWYGLPVRGGGEDWADVSEAIEQVYTEYEARQSMRHQHLLVTQSAMEVAAHQALTVLVDEAFLICKHLNVSKKGQINYWELLTEVLGSGARKVNISVILLSQSTNVLDLDLSGPMRRNFTRVALDAATIKLMIAQEETDKEYRTQLYESLIGMQYPATTVIDSRVMLLDRTGLDVIAARHVDAKSRLWLPSVPVPRIQKGPISPPEGKTNGDGDGDAALLHQLVDLQRKGIKREDARSVYGLEFRNDLWTLAGEIASGN